ncbi:MAG: four helix bundle protein [Parcubacteria group bacterium]|nr:four helix bundle protein [Parcubacteria group bacterium]|tara:strand:+ start:1996 stop:2406 length:411 start_codon:yes stop_codon:yes gene_type:complete
MYKSQAQNYKSQINSNGQNQKRYDLEDRTLKYGKRIIKMCKALPKNSINFRLIDQVIRSGTSMGANYREANETETKKDFQYRMRICRKEGKETIYWLHLIVETNSELVEKTQPLLQETNELVKIFASIIEKTKAKK